MIGAAAVGAEAIVLLLLKNGAQIDAQDLEGNSALMEASWEGHVSVISTLLDNQANINLQENCQATLTAAGAVPGFDCDVTIVVEDGVGNDKFQHHLFLLWKRYKAISHTQFF